MNDDLNQRLDQVAPPHTRAVGSDVDADPLVSTAQRLAQGPNVNFSQEALDRIEARLQAKMDTMPLYRVHPRGRRYARLLSYAATLALVFGFMALMVGRAAASSLPGDRLYSVKRMMERVQVALAAKDDEAELHITFADKRTEEFESLLEQGRVYPRALEAANDELNQALDLLAEGYGSWQDVQPQMINLTERQNHLLGVAQTQSDHDERAYLQALASEQLMIRHRIDALESQPIPPVPIVTPTWAFTATVSLTPTVTVSPTATISPSPTDIPTKLPTVTPTPTATFSPMPSPTVTARATLRPSPLMPTILVQPPTQSGGMGEPGYGQENGGPAPAGPGPESSGQGNGSQGDNSGGLPNGRRN
jgi:hypothetical protein